MENNRKVLLFQVGMAKTAQIRALCQKLQIQALTIDSGQYHKTLGQLAGIRGFGVLDAVPANAASVPGNSRPLPGIAIPRMEMLVFSGISPDMLDTFLEEYRQAGIPPIPLRAVITPTNISWDVPTLYAELAREHMQFAGICSSTAEAAGPGGRGKST